ncbi:hypothetical protein M9Y10_036454 [Tritrichomonas musculus]|uniref:Uncharacterized protein n=1 Tax=Tritrichomonas musculus TaxID=1915356 RepID=A0ABR2GU37_9EUKA
MFLNLQNLVLLNQLNAQPIIIIGMELVYTVNMVPHCSVHIPNCAPGFCPLIQNVYYCNKCENGYITSIDRRFCVLPTCFDNDVNCKECDTNDASKCINCDESNHFKLNQDGKCVCDEEGGYKSENGLCLDETQRSCLGEGKDTLCKICKDETHCETCLDGASLDSNGTCVKSEISIANCTVNKFVNSQEICVTCEGDLKPTFDGKSCVEDGNATCTENIIGCANCSTRGTNVCIVCDETKFFKPTPVEIGGISRCNCIDGLDFFEGQCIKPIPAVTPSAFPPDKIDSLDSAAVPNATDSSQVTFNKGGNYKDDTLYTYNLPQTVNKVEVPSEIQNFQLNVGNGQEVTIVLPESGNDVAVNFTGTSTIKVNPVQSSNLDVVGDGTITINTPNDGDLKEDEVLNIGTIQPTGEEITLKSNEKLNIKKIDVYPVEGKPITTITGTDSGTSCEGLFLQGRSNLVVKNIDLVKDIYIGLLSSLRMDNAKFEKAKFHIKYNRQTPETVFPIVFNGKGGFPHFDGDIVVERQEVEGEIIQEDQEELLISEFNGDSLEESYKACLNYSSHYRGGESFNDPECYNSTNTNGDDANKAYMRSTKSQKKGDDGKKGLSGGAIAGIVIACVVVVAAIIALLVYFLVIKKRNQSTTSTQGDSSIAI